MASSGPTLQGLSVRLAVGLDRLSALFLFRAAGRLLGALAAGWLYSRVHGHRLMMLGALGVAAAMALIPAASGLPGVNLLFFARGLMEALVDVGANTLVIRGRGRDAGPVLGALHFSFGIGASLGPVAIGWVYALGGSVANAYQLLAVGSLLLLPGLALTSPPPPAPTAVPDGHPGRTGWVLALVVLAVALYVGSEVALGNWLGPLALRGFGMDEVGASFVIAAFWGGMTVGRLLSILLVARIHPGTLVLADIGVSLVAVALILIGLGQPTALWIGATAAGLALGSVFPMALALGARFLPTGGSLASWYLVGAGLGVSSLPWVVGQALAGAGPAPALSIILLGLILTGGAMAGIVRIARRREHIR